MQFDNCSLLIENCSLLAENCRLPLWADYSLFIVHNTSQLGMVVLSKTVPDSFGFWQGL
jgi:hypothetical protein